MGLEESTSEEDAEWGILLSDAWKSVELDDEANFLDHVHEIWFGSPLRDKYMKYFKNRSYYYMRKKPKKIIKLIPEKDKNKIARLNSLVDTLKKMDEDFGKASEYYNTLYEAKKIKS
jgi:hypothetical protein